MEIYTQLKQVLFAMLHVFDSYINENKLRQRDLDKDR